MLKRADHVVLPGVGSFGDAMENLNRYHLVQVIHEIVEKGTPFLGICLGLQILFERSEESPGVEGLGLLKGEILRIPDKEGLKDSAHGLEFHPSAERGTLIQRHPAGIVCLLCPLLLSESRRGGNYKKQRQSTVHTSMHPWKKEICSPASSTRKRVQILDLPF